MWHNTKYLSNAVDSPISTWPWLKDNALSSPRSTSIEVHTVVSYSVVSSCLDSAIRPFSTFRQTDRAEARRSRAPPSPPLILLLFILLSPSPQAIQMFPSPPPCAPSRRLGGTRGHGDICTLLAAAGGTRGTRRHLYLTTSPNGGNVCKMEPKAPKMEPTGAQNEPKWIQKGAK